MVESAVEQSGVRRILCSPFCMRQVLDPILIHLEAWSSPYDMRYEPNLIINESVYPLAATLL